VLRAILCANLCALQQRNTWFTGSIAEARAQRCGRTLRDMVEHGSAQHGSPGVVGSVAFMEVGTSSSESYWVPLASNSMGVENLITVARTASVLVYTSYRACMAG